MAAGNHLGCTHGSFRPNNNNNNKREKALDPLLIDSTRALLLGWEAEMSIPVESNRTGVAVSLSCVHNTDGTFDAAIFGDNR